MKFDIKNSMIEYSRLMKERPEEFLNSDQTAIITDAVKIKSFFEQTRNKVGVVYRSEFNIFVVDLVQDDHRLYTYERLLPAVKQGAVIALPIYNGKFVLINQFRHALRGYQYSFPRGYGENCLTDEENACKELKEELGANVEKILRIGTVVADSGLSGTNVSVFACAISKAELKYHCEGIRDMIEITKEELDEMIKDGKINDGLSLSAYLLFCCNKCSITDFTI